MWAISWPDPMQFNGKRSVFLFSQTKTVPMSYRIPHRCFLQLVLSSLSLQTRCLTRSSLISNMIVTSMISCVHLQWACSQLIAVLPSFFGYFTPWENSWKLKWQKKAYLQRFFRVHICNFKFGILRYISTKYKFPPHTPKSLQPSDQARIIHLKK